MRPRIRPEFPVIWAGWAVLAVALSGLLLNSLSAPLEEDLGLGLLYALRGPEPAPDRVVIVGIDHESALRLQTPDDPHDWPRRRHAELIGHAQRLGAELVAFNIFFGGPSDDPGADRAMADAMREAGNVVLTDYVKPRQVQPGIYVESVVEPTARLTDAALATAPFLLPRNAAGATRFLAFFGDEDRRATLPTLLCLADILHQASHGRAGPLRPVDSGLAALIASQAPDLKTRPDVDALVRTLSRHPSTGADPGSLIGSHSTMDSPPDVPRRLESLGRLLRGDGIRYFNHYGPAGSFRTIPYHQLVEPPPGAQGMSLENKILLVGYLDDFQPETTEGLFNTHYSQISSVELAATALANLLEDKRVEPAFSPLHEVLWLLVWGGSLGLCARAFSLRGGLACIVLLGVGYLAAATMLFQADGVWLPVVIPLGWQVPAGLLAAVWLHYVRRARRERRMHSVMQRFIPVDVFSQLSRHEDSDTLPEYGRLTMGVCLATDAGRYTALAETMEPVALAALMNRYYQAIFEPVTRHGGWISDVIGDAMLAIWLTEGDTAPARHEALAAALELQEAVRRFESDHQLVFPIRMGLHFGELRIGYVGTADRGEIRAVGDTVNTAARLEALNKLLGSHILVSEPFLEGLPVEGVRPLGEFLLAGKSRPVAVAGLAGASGALPEPRELHGGFRDALALFRAERWLEAYAAFTRLSLRFPEDGPTRFYRKTCQSCLVDPDSGGGDSGIPVEKPDAARVFSK